MRDFLNKRPMLSSAVAASVISVIAMYAEKALFIICLSILCLIFVMIYKRIRGEMIFAVLCVLAVAVSAVFATGEIRKTENYENVLCSGEFVVIQEPVSHGNFYSATLETISSDVLGRGDKLTVSYNEGEMEFSQRIKAQISVSSLEDNEYRSSWYSNGIYLGGYVISFSSADENETVLSVVKSVREYIKNKIFRYYGTQEAATMLALVTGDKSYFTDEFYSNVKSAGVAHVMVVSGMHLSVIVALFLFLSERFFYNRYVKALTIFTVTVAVAAICGFTMSIMRAGITYILLAISLVFERQNTPVNTLGCAVTFILISNPFAMLNVAFQLSVLSTFAILVVTLPIIEYVRQNKIIKSKVLISLASAVLISISTLIFTAPVAACVFGYISNVSVFSNLLIGTPASAAMIMCILGFVLPFAEGLLFGISEMIVKYINSTINYFGSLPFATTELPKYSVIIFVLMIIIILWILLACKNRRDMLKLKEIRLKKYKEGGKKLKWR